MEDRIDNQICERSDDLVSFLYHELNDQETKDFKQHLAGCHACAQEVTALGRVRAGVVAWREQSLGMAPIQTEQRLGFTQHETRSALAAIRQFFALSPVWLKGAVAFASIAFFAVVAILIMNLNSKPVAPLVQTDKKYSEAEMRARVQAEIQALNEKPNAPIQNQSSEAPERAPVIAQRATPKLNALTSNPKTRRAPLTKSEREQLAADLRLISPSEEDLDLLGEQINR